MSSLDALLRNAAIWRGSEQSHAPTPGIPSGFAALDEKLGGWPRGALAELIPQREGIGELSILLPALANASAHERWIAFINPPYIPYAPALAGAGVNLASIVVVRAQTSADALWAMEQSLRSGACSVVLGWPGFVTEQATRRLQLAAETGQAFGIYFTACGAVARTSPVPYRLRVDAHVCGTQVEILKRRGGAPTTPVYLENVVALPGSASPADRNFPAGRRVA